MGRGTLQLNGVTGGSSDPGFLGAAPLDFNGFFGEAGRREDDVRSVSRRPTWPTSLWRR